MELIAPFGGILVLAFLAESLTEYLFSRPLADLKINREYLRYVAAGVGVVLALVYKVDILAQFPGLGAEYPVVGRVLSGLVLGRGANFAHDFYSRFLNPKGGQADPQKGRNP
ncbi:MAG: hypothetical protein V3U26_00280 [Dehalococcoidia bacterium]